MRKGKKASPKLVDNENQVVLEPSKYSSLEENLKAKGVKLSVKSFDTRSAVAKDIFKSQTSFTELINKNDPTQIPFFTTNIGNFLVNPSTVSLSTLMKIAQNEIVAKCLEMNVISVLNSIGPICHENQEIQKCLRLNVEQSNGGLRRIVENMMTAQWSAFSMNYIRDYVDDDGFTRLEQLDLLPPSTVLFSATPEGNIENIYMYIYSYPYANTQNLFSFPFNFIGGIADVPCCDGGPDALASYGNLDYVLRTNILNTFGLIALDKEKCVHFVYDGTIKVANPYGWNPLTRRVYDLVMLYDLYKDLQSTFLSYKACPLLVGYAKANQTVDDPTGNGATMTALDGLYRSMSNMGFNGALLLSGLKDEIYHIEAVNVEGNTDAFDKALNWLAKQIEQCLGLFNLDDSSFASATAQTSIYGRITYNMKDKIEEAIKHSIFKYLIHKNFGTHITDYGYFDNNVQNIDDQLKLTKIFLESAATKGFNTSVLKKDNDFQRLTLNQPILTDEEFAELKLNADQEGADHPMDNSDRVNTRESKPHYKKGKNSDA